MPLRMKGRAACPQAAAGAVGTPRPATHFLGNSRRLGLGRPPAASRVHAVQALRNRTNPRAIHLARVWRNGRARMQRGCAGVGALGLTLIVAAGQAAPVPPPGAALFGLGAIHSLRLSVGAADLEGLRRSPRAYVRAIVRCGEQVYPDVALRLKGATGSFQPVDDKPALTLDFARFAPAQRFHGLRRIYLNNAVEDPTFLNEWLGTALFRAAGLPAQRVAHARVQLNGRPLGLYVLKEGFTQDFIELHFARGDGALYDNDWGCDIDQRMHRNFGPEPGRGQPELDVLAQAVREPDLERRWVALDRVLDVDRFLTFMALEVILVHRDGYCLARNNFRIYVPPDTGRVVFLPDGLDQLFGRADVSWKPRPTGLVAAALLSTPEGQRRYHARMLELLDTVFQPAQLASQLDRRLLEIEPALSRREFHDLRREAAALEQRVVRRHQSLLAQLAQPEPSTLEFEAGTAPLIHWFKVDEPEGGQMDQLESQDGVRSLHIRAGPRTSASWRVQVALRPGQYRFEARAKVASVAPLPFGRTQGAGLRVGGHIRGSASLVGDSDWQVLTAVFEVTAANPAVELLCELNASRGDFWVDLDSVRLVEDAPP